MFTTCRAACFLWETLTRCMTCVTPRAGRPWLTADGSGWAPGETVSSHAAGDGMVRLIRCCFHPSGRSLYLVYNIRGDWRQPVDDCELSYGASGNATVLPETVRPQQVPHQLYVQLRQPPVLRHRRAYRGHTNRIALPVLCDAPYTSRYRHMIPRRVRTDNMLCPGCLISRISASVAVYVTVTVTVSGKRC